MSDDALHIIQETHDKVRLLRINRPEKRNGLSAKTVVELTEAVQDAYADSSINVIALTGVGDAFCAGADLGSGKPADFIPDPLSGTNAVSSMFRALRVECNKPIIGGINGMAIGGGLALALMTDIRIASAKATFNGGYARIASSPDGGMTWTLTQALGYEKALRFMFETKGVDAQTALEMGLISEVVEDDVFESTFMDYCLKVAGLSQHTTRPIKSLMNRSQITFDLDRLLDDEFRLAIEGTQSEDGQAAIRKLFSKSRKKS